MKRQKHGNNKGNTDIPSAVVGEFFGKPKKISQSGLLCHTSRKIPEMTRLDVRFQLPMSRRKTVKEHNWMECSGVVVRCQKKKQNKEQLSYEVAIFFDRLSSKDRCLLAWHFDSAADIFSSSQL